MEVSFLLLFITVATAVTPVSAATQRGLMERLLLATQQRPWLWGVCVFTVGLPIILFISFMWPDVRFGPPDERFYYKKSDDVQPDDAQINQQTQISRSLREAVRRRRDVQDHRKFDVEMKDD
ncbi:hypothetical protein LDENG_00108890 [Lucifuga dentata]|nr:hypothetical protein LDENG_00108890 [Lucifuga dentata]